MRSEHDDVRSDLLGERPNGISRRARDDVKTDLFNVRLCLAQQVADASDDGRIARRAARRPGLFWDMQDVQRGSGGRSKLVSDPERGYR